MFRGFLPKSLVFNTRLSENTKSITKSQSETLTLANKGSG
jgi:hypothetical protein